MSNSTNYPQADDAVSHNTYFDGKVQSLGLETANGKATLGVMKKGEYTFSTSSSEKMVVLSGTMEVKLDGILFHTYNEHDEFEVSAGVSFEVKCNADVAYLCYYGQ